MTATFEAVPTVAPEQPPGEPWVLRLYVNNQTPRGVAALARLRKLCETHLAGRYTIEVVDLLKHPQLAEGEQIIAVPTLVRCLPPPMCKVVGDLSDEVSTLVGLQLLPPSALAGVPTPEARASLRPLSLSLAAAGVLERLLATPGTDKIVLRLYMVGTSPRAAEATTTIQTICDLYLPGRHQLEVIDLVEHPELAAQERIIATPTLVRELPLPARRLVGDLTNPDRIVLVFE